MYHQEKKFEINYEYQSWKLIVDAMKYKCTTNHRTVHIKIEINITT